MVKDRRIKVLRMIAEDMRKDAEHYEGQAFTGKNVSEYFGKQGAAIAALANILRLTITEEEPNEKV